MFYNTTRKLVLKGVDGVVFVADSQRAMLEANVESFRNLEENLAEMGLSVDSLPLVAPVQQARPPRHLHRRRDERGAQPPATGRASRPRRSTGAGVFETLKGISKLTLLSLKKRLTRGSETAAPAPRPALRPPPPGRPAAARPPAPAAPAPGRARAGPARRAAGSPRRRRP